jgi:hypothetical protein
MSAENLTCAAKALRFMRDSIEEALTVYATDRGSANASLEEAIDTIPFLGSMLKHDEELAGKFDLIIISGMIDDFRGAQAAKADAFSAALKEPAKALDSLVDAVEAKLDGT